MKLETMKLLKLQSRMQLEVAKLLKTARSQKLKWTLQPHLSKAEPVKSARI